MPVNIVSAVLRCLGFGSFGDCRAEYFFGVSVMHVCANTSLRSSVLVPISEVICLGWGEEAQLTITSEV